MKGNWIISLPILLLHGFFIISASGKYINTPCQTHTDCGLDNHLQCINDVCQCDSNSQIYDQNTHKCLLLVGQQCEIETHDYQYNRQHSVPIKCVPHADCTKSVCRCKPGYRYSANFLCKPDFGAHCHARDDCDGSLGLVCSNRGTCDCYNATWTYQEQFGCVDPKNPAFNEMLKLLNETDFLLKENNLELKDMFNDLGLQNEDSEEYSETEDQFRKVFANERQFQDTYNTNDLQFAAQNQSPQQSGGGGLNIQQLLSLFQTFQSLIPRNNNNGGGRGGFWRNLFGGGNNNQGGYPEASTTTTPASGYGPPGEPEGMGERMGLLRSFLNLFNQMIPIVKQLRMRFMPLKFFRNLLNRFSPTTTAAPPPPPPAQAVNNPAPTVIQSSGNFQQNPIFDNNGQQAAPPNQPAGSFRFFMRSRDRFRNFLRGNQANKGGYPAARPASHYGAPAESPPPSDGAPAAGGDGAEGDPPPPAPASSSQQNTYLNNHQLPPTSNRNHFQGQQSQAQYNTINLGGHQAIPPAPTTQRNQNFGGGASLPRPATFDSGHHPNHDSFFDGRQPQQQQQQYQQNQQQHQQQHQQHQPQQGFQNNNNYNNQQNNDQTNNHHFNNNNQFNAQATSHHHQSTFVGHNQQAPHRPQPPHQNQNNNGNFQAGFHSAGSNPRPPFPSIGNVTPPPIPQLKLQVPQSPKIPASAHESLSQNFILSEADDPHPGFTPHSTSPPPKPQQQHQQQESYRTSARFERIGQVDHSSYQPHTAAQNWRESF